MKSGLSKNNLIAFLCLFIVLISGWSYFMTDYYVASTSKAITDARVSLCYEEFRPEFIIYRPGDFETNINRFEVIEGNYTLRGYVVRDGEVNEGNILKNVSYILQSSIGSFDVGVGYRNEYSFFESTFDSTTVPDQNCNYIVRTQAFFNNSCTLVDTSTSDLVTVDNIPIEPNWSNFANNITTNFSEFSKWSVLNRVFISDGTYGRVYFPNNSIYNFDDMDFNRYIEFDDNYFKIHRNLTCIKSVLEHGKELFVTFYNQTFLSPEPQIKNGELWEDCEDCQKYSYVNGTYHLKIYRMGEYQLTETASLDLGIRDDTDAASYYSNQMIGFYANLTDEWTLEDYHSDEVDCRVDFDLGYETTTPKRMVYNSTHNAYYYERNFSRPGEFSWNVNCNATALELGEHFASDYFEVRNNYPSLVHDIPNMSYPANAILNGYDLDNYFEDPDGDILSYEASDIANILVYINSTSNIFTITPETNWYGNRTVVFYAEDPYNGSASSNEVWLEFFVLPPKEPSESFSRSVDSIPACIPQWDCGDWSKCKPSGFKNRNCVDNRKCNITIGSPDTARECNYKPTCEDNILNGEETGVDCGGLCPTCASCRDGKQNQRETGIDCGGPCLPCPTCYDGISNQNEEKIDCGGICGACPTCFDGILNQKEELTDCGGQCGSCEKVYSLEKPRFTAAFWTTFLVAFILAAISAFLLRERIIYFIDELLKKIAVSFRKLKPKIEVLPGYVSDYITMSLELNRIKGNADVVKLKQFIRNLLVYVNEDVNLDKFGVNLMNSFYSSKTKSLFQRIYEQYKIEKIEFESLIKSLDKLMLMILIEKLMVLNFNYETIFRRTAGMLKDYSGITFKLFKKLIYDLYLALPIDVKGKVYKILEEIDHKGRKMREKKALALLLVLGAMFLVSSIFSTGPTGFSVIESDFYIEQLEVIEIHPGESFRTDLEIYGGNAPYEITWNLDVIKILEDNTIVGLPIEETGIYFVQIQVKDKSGNLAETILEIIVK